jgi:hypothetical protein
MAISREVKQGRQSQGADERIAYTLTTTPWGSTPTGISVKAFDVTGGKRVDVTATVFPANAPTAAGDVITLSLLRALTPGHAYRIEVQFTTGGNLEEPYFFVDCDL